jgi:hypothetical protein
MFFYQVYSCIAILSVLIDILLFFSPMFFYQVYSCIAILSV